MQQEDESKKEGVNPYVVGGIALVSVASIVCPPFGAMVLARFAIKRVVRSLQGKRG